MNLNLLKSFHVRPSSPNIIITGDKRSHESSKNLNAAATAAYYAAGDGRVSLSYVPYERSVCDVLHNVLSELPCDEEPSVLAIDLATVARQFFHFRHQLPGVHIHYAVKCFPDPIIVATLARLGASFDCASGHELELARQALYDCSEKFLDKRIIFANPVKNIVDLRHAERIGVQRVTFDNVDELHKLALFMPSARALLRVATDDATSAVPLSAKFGARMHEVRGIIATAAHLGVDVVGVSFHVGSNAQSLVPYEHAFKTARMVFDIAKTFDFKMSIIDVGGGFPGTENEADVTFDQIASCIRRNLNSLFDPDIQVLAEPGRYLVRACATLATRVIRRVSSADGIGAYCIGDGVYGSFRNAWLFGLQFEPSVVLARHHSDFVNSEKSHLLGITMEACDVVARHLFLPRLNEGDWLIFENMGSYASSLRTVRADIGSPQVIYLFCEGLLCPYPPVNSGFELDLVN